MRKSLLICNGHWARIHGQLYQGGAPLLYSPTRYREFEPIAVDTVVLCAKEYQPESNALGPAHIIRCPYGDSLDASHTELLSATRTGVEVAGRIKRGEVVLVTCWAGLNRSGLVTSIAMLHLQPAWSPQDILDRLRSRRPNSMSNGRFVQWFITYAQSLRR